jgi:hypothetical protein
VYPLYSLCNQKQKTINTAEHPFTDKGNWSDKQWNLNVCKRHLRSGARSGGRGGDGDSLGGAKAGERTPAKKKQKTANTADRPFTGKGNWTVKQVEQAKASLAGTHEAKLYAFQTGSAPEQTRKDREGAERTQARQRRRPGGKRGGPAKRGMGVASASDLVYGQVVCPYHGVWRTQAEFDDVKGMGDNVDDPFYSINVGSGPSFMVLDARSSTDLGLGCLLNTCKTHNNCQLKYCEIFGKKWLFLVAIKHISAHTELLWDYASSSFDPDGCPGDWVHAANGCDKCEELADTIMF